MPWRTALDAARGARAGHAEFERLWAQAVRRPPHHYGCHVAALEYLAAASPAAHRECLDFAETAAQDAPEDALVRALPVRAAFTCLTTDDDGDAAGVHRARLDAAADRAIALSAAHPAADPWPAELRNLYVRAGTPGAAPGRGGTTASDRPVRHVLPLGPGHGRPLGRFLQVRADVRAAVASGSGRQVQVIHEVARRSRPPRRPQSFCV